MIKVTNIDESYYNYFKDLFKMALAKEFGVGDTPPEFFQDFDMTTPTSGTYILKNELEEPIGYSQWGITYNRTGWFSLFIDPKHQGRGYGKLAFNVITEKLFNEQNLKNILHAVMIANCKMTSIIESYGCRRVGEIRQRALTLDETGQRVNTSCVQYEITLEDFNSKNSKVVCDSQKSYGIDDPEFLEFEKKRLVAQNSIQMGPLEHKLAEIIATIDKAKVMDLGCGLGTLINALSIKFPLTDFVGVDSESSFICLAEKTKSTSNVQFIYSDFYRLQDQIADVDVFFMRIVAQHLGEQGLNSFFELFKKHAKPTAKLLILDVDDRSWSLSPKIPGFDLLIDSCNFNQKKYGGDRQIGSKCKDIATKNGLKVDSFQICPFDSYNTGLNNFSAIISALFDFKADPDFLVERDIQIVRENFEKWKNNPESFGYGCLFLTQVGKNA